jgi:hypothetical protein
MRYGTRLAALASSYLSPVPISRSPEPSSRRFSPCRSSQTTFTWAGILMRRNRSTISPRFSMPSRKQCARLDLTIIIYVYETGSRTACLVRHFFQIRLLSDFSTSTADLTLTGGDLLTINGQSSERNTTESLFWSSFARGTAKMLTSSSLRRVLHQRCTFAR